TLRGGCVAPQVPPTTGVESSANRLPGFARNLRPHKEDPRSRQMFPRPILSQPPARARVRFSAPPCLRCGLLLVLLIPVSLRAEDGVRLRESFVPGYQYRVKVHVNGSGEMALPAEKAKGPPEMLQIVAKSAIEYDERVLEVSAGDVRKSLRN